MTIAFVRRNESAGSLTCAYGANVVSGNLLVVVIGTSSTFGVTGISDTVGSTWTQRAAATNSTGGIIAYVYSATAASSGANTVTLTTSFSVVPTGIAIFEFSGNHATPFDVAGTNTGNSTSAAQSVTTTAANDVIVGIVYAIGGGASAITSGYTLTGNAGAGSLSDAYNVDVGATGSKTLTFTIPSGEWAMSMAAFKQASSAFIASKPIVISQAVNRASRY